MDDTERRLIDERRDDLVLAIGLLRQAGRLARTRLPVAGAEAFLDGFDDDLSHARTKLGLAVAALHAATVPEDVA